MENIKHIGLIGDNGSALAIAHLLRMMEDKMPIMIATPQQEVEMGINARGLMSDVIMDLLPPKLIELEQPKSGRENRRERRKTERKNKKL